MDQTAGNKSNKSPKIVGTKIPVPEEHCRQTRQGGLDGMSRSEDVLKVRCRPLSVN